MNNINLNSKKPVSKRSLSRLMAVQILYQYQYRDQSEDILNITNEVIDNYLLDSEIENISSYREKIDLNLLNDLLAGVLLVLEKIDDKIDKFLDKNHSLEQIPDVMLQILRLGAFELQYMKNNPVKVVINEYVNITDAFYDWKKVNFVNAVLDKIAKAKL